MIQPFGLLNVSPLKKTCKKKKKKTESEFVDSFESMTFENVSIANKMEFGFAYVLDLNIFID